MKTNGVTTMYFSGGRMLASYIVADTMEEAEQLRTLRNIGEKIDSDVIVIETLPDYRKATNTELLKSFPAVIKQISFLSCVAFASGKLSLDQVLGNMSLVDKLSAVVTMACPPYDQGDGTVVNETRALLYVLQDAAPGTFPPVNKKA